MDMNNEPTKAAKSAPDFLPFNPDDFIIPPYRVSLDDFEIVLPDGTKHYPHYGQSIWIEPWSATMTDTVDAAEIRKLMDDETSREEAHAAVNGFYEMLSTQVVAWDVTDNRRRPFDQPWMNATVFGEIGSRLAWHIYAKVNGRDQKKVSDSDSNSRGTSSTSAGKARRTQTE